MPKIGQNWLPFMPICYYVCFAHSIAKLYLLRVPQYYQTNKSSKAKYFFWQNRMGKFEQVFVHCLFNKKCIIRIWHAALLRPIKCIFYYIAIIVSIVKRDNLNNCNTYDVFWHGIINWRKTKTNPDNLNGKYLVY